MKERPQKLWDTRSSPRLYNLSFLFWGWGCLYFIFNEKINKQFIIGIEKFYLSRIEPRRHRFKKD